MLRLSVLVVLAVGWTGPARGQSAGLAFLRFGSDAAAVAMGDGGVATSDDAFSVYWNPAGLATAATNSAALSHVIWFGNVRTYALGSRFRAGQKGGVGVFVNAASVGDIAVRERPGDPSGFFDAQFTSIGVAYGRQVGPLRVGAGVKYLSERIFVEEATGYAFDVGAQLALADDAVLIGGAWQNLGRMDELDEDATPLPRMVRGGLAVRPFRILTAFDEADVFHLLANVEVSHIPPMELTQLHLGLAAQVLDIIRVRGGYIGTLSDTDGDVRRFTFGAGLVYEALLFDYAFLPFQDGFGSGHVLTVSYRW